MMTVTTAWNQPVRVKLWDNVVNVFDVIFMMSQHAESHSTEIVNNTKIDDTNEITATLNGDGEAFGRLLTKYQPTITIQMRRFSRDPLVIEELVHDVFVEAYLSLKLYKSQAPLLHWLRIIAVRVGYRYWKQQSRDRKATVQLSQIDDRLERLAIGQITKASDASEILSDLLEGLSPRDRLVLTLLYWDGCTVSEAAKLAGWSQTMVKVQAYRARRRLKKMIEESRK